MLLGNVGNHPHFLLIQHNAGGITGVGDQNGTGIAGDQAFDPLPVGIAVALLGAGVQCTDPATGSMDESGVVGIVGLGDNDLGIRIQNAQAGQQQCFAATGSHQHIPGSQINTQVRIVIPDGVDQPRCTGRSLVGQGLIIEIADSLQVCLRSGQIRLTDIQMVDGLTCFFGLNCQRMELPHGRRLAAVGVDGNFHMYLPWRAFAPGYVYILW